MFTGCTRGIQSHSEAYKCNAEKDTPSQCQVVVLWLHLLLLHTGMFIMANHMSKQKSKVTCYICSRYKLLAELGVRPSSRHSPSEANFTKIRPQFLGSSACVYITTYRTGYIF